MPDDISHLFPPDCGDRQFSAITSLLRGNTDEPVYSDRDRPQRSCNLPPLASLWSEKYFRVCTIT
jgi:hypothetical protein